MILAAAANRRRRRADPLGAAASGSPGAPRVLAGAGAARPTCCARTSPTTRCTAPASVGGPMVWGISPEMPGTGLGALAHAMRHVARVGRPVGGSGAMPEALLASFVEHRRRAAHRRPASTAIVCDGERVGGVRSSTAPRSRARIVVSACDPQRTFLAWLAAPAGRPTSTRRTVARHAARTTATSRRSTPIVTAAPGRARRRRTPSASTPIDRADARRDRPRLPPDAAAGGCSIAPGCSSTCRRCSTRRWRPDHPGRHVLQPRGAAHAVPPHRRMAGFRRTAPLARAVRRPLRDRASSTRSSSAGR